MDNAFSTILGIGIAGILLIGVPMLAMAERNDDVAQQVVQSVTDDFAYSVVDEGKITEDNYSKYIDELGDTMHTFDVEMEVKHLDENIGNKSSWTSSSVVGENSTISVHTATIEDSLKEKGSYNLKSNDQLTVTATNTDTTMAQSFRNIWYRVSGKGTYSMKAQKTVTVP
ncbi:MAG: hypothetical protein IKF52_05110 [Clostridia bacterium]|nr:hypothetical protein [Clostridia bacterium]